MKLVNYSDDWMDQINLRQKNAQRENVPSLLVGDPGRSVWMSQIVYICCIALKFYIGTRETNYNIYNFAV